MHLLLLLLSYFFTIKGQEWSQIGATGDIPPRASGYLAVKLGNLVVKYGGSIQGAGPNNTTYFSETHIFNLATHEWTKVANPSPIGRTFAEAVAISPYELIMYGGTQYFQVPLSVQVFDEYWHFNVLTETWTQIFFSGDLPTPRFEHGMVFDETHASFYIWGGEQALTPTSLLIVGDMYKCSIDTFTCSKITQLGDVPVPRVNLILRNLDENTFIASGGFSFTPRGAKSGLFTYNIENQTWTREEYEIHDPLEKGRFPTAREAGLFEIVNDILVIYAGDVDGNTYFNLVNDTWTAHLKNRHYCGEVSQKHIWQYQDISSPTPVKRIKSVVYGDEIYTFGGILTGGYIGVETCTTNVYKYNPCIY